ncbi:MAG TPA: hypothetical protein VE993_02065, partial [Stellaceae bacterium]|nr:hypothetical protein [Stellaceae bacterium]
MLFSDRKARQKSAAARALDRGRPDKAVRLLRALAEAGDAEAQYRLAELYETGTGVVQSFADATHWFRAAAEQGSVPAQARLGEIYLNGRAAPTSIGPGLREERDGSDSALLRLFPNGVAIAQDFAAAARWNAAAAAAGHPAAQAR